MTILIGTKSSSSFISEWLSEPALACTSCGLLAFNIDQLLFEKYFKGEDITCFGCKSKFDLWARALKQVLSPFRSKPLLLIGAFQRGFLRHIGVHEVLKVRLIDYGIPETSRILDVHLTPIGGEQPFVFPIELSSNNITAPKNQHELFFYGRPFGSRATEIDQSTQTPVHFVVTFVNHGPHEHALWNFARAFESFVDNDFYAMILPAIVAVEDNAKQLRSYAKAKDIIKYPSSPSKDLPFKLLLPMIADSLEFPRLFPEIMNLMRNLWDLRNEIAHNGYISSEFSKDAAAERLVATIFTYRYLMVVMNRINP